MRQSSLEAHEIIKPKKETHYKIIINALKQINKPCTSKTIAKATKGKLSYHDVAKRLSEMENKELVKVVGRAYKIPCRPLLWSL